MDVVASLVRRPSRRRPATRMHAARMVWWMMTRLVWMMMRMVVNAEGGAEMDAKDYYYDDDGSTRTAPPLKMMH